MSQYVNTILLKINNKISFNTLCIISCIVLLILIVNAFQIRYIETQLLAGFWKADSDFCKNAGIKSMIMYLGNNEFSLHEILSIVSSGCVIRGYILLENAEGIIINNPVNIKFKSKYDLSQTLSDYQKYKITIDWLEETDYELFFPSVQTLYYYPKIGKLTLTQNENIYAVLFKDNSLTALMHKEQTNTEQMTKSKNNYNMVQNLKKILKKKPQAQPAPVNNFESEEI
jgi:hypothetical protein